MSDNASLEAIKLAWEIVEMVDYDIYKDWKFDECGDGIGELEVNKIAQKIEQFKSQGAGMQAQEDV